MLNLKSFANPEHNDNLSINLSNINFCFEIGKLQNNHSMLAYIIQLFSILSDLEWIIMLKIKDKKKKIIKW